MWDRIKAWLQGPRKQELDARLCSITFNVVQTIDGCEVNVDLNCKDGAEGYMAAAIHHVSTGALYPSVEQALVLLLELTSGKDKEQLVIIQDNVLEIQVANEEKEEEVIVKNNKPLIGPADVYDKKEL